MDRKKDVDLQCAVLRVCDVSLIEYKLCASGSVVEYRLAKARVAGSNPVSRFFFFPCKYWIFLYLQGAFLCTSEEVNPCYSLFLLPTDMMAYAFSDCKMRMCLFLVYQGNDT